MARVALMLQGVGQCGHHFRLDPPDFVSVGRRLVIKTRL